MARMRQYRLSARRALDRVGAAVDVDKWIRRTWRDRSQCEREA